MKKEKYKFKAVGLIKDTAMNMINFDTIPKLARLQRECISNVLEEKYGNMTITYIST